MEHPLSDRVVFNLDVDGSRYILIKTEPDAQVPFFSTMTPTPTSGLCPAIGVDGAGLDISDCSRPFAKGIATFARPVPSHTSFVHGSIRVT